MTTDIIIDQYNKRPFFRRMISDGATTFVWGGWAWLCKLHHFFQFRFLLLGIPQAIQEPAVALVSTSSALMLLNTINNPKPTCQQVYNEDIANYFNVSIKQLEESKNSQVCVVHHDEYGNILRIQKR